MSNQQPDFQLPNIPPETGGNLPVQNPANPVVPVSPADPGSQVNPANPVNPTVDSTQQQINNQSAAMSADDLDLIEKEWVEKAKQIVNNTQGNPHQQNLAISKMKADYIKKRYNKDIKIND